MLYNEAVKNENPNASLPYSDEDIELFRNGSDPIGHPNTDWYKETFKNFSFSSNTISQSMVDLKRQTTVHLSVTSIRVV